MSKRRSVSRQGRFEREDTAPREDKRWETIVKEANEAHRKKRSLKAILADEKAQEMSQEQIDRPIPVIDPGKNIPVTTQMQVVVPGGNNPNVAIPLGGKKRVPKPEWLASLSADELRQWAIKKAWREGNRYKRRYSGRRRYPYAKRRRYSYGRGGGARPLIVSAGTARGIRGLGAYHSDQANAGPVAGDGTRVGGGYDPPYVNNPTGDESVVFTHREYVGDLFSGTFPPGGSATGFKIQSFQFNPGNSQFFPFLAAIATRFQEYKFLGAVVELKSMSSSYAANLSLGTMILGADYNVLGPDPVTKQQLENMQYSDSRKPDCSFVMGIECDPKNDSNTHLYVAKDNEYDTGDPRLYDLCKVYVASQGIPQEEAPIAEIWISYKVALYKPIIVQSINTVDNFYATGMNFVNDGLFTEPIIRPGSSANFSFPTLREILFPTKTACYMLSLHWTGNAVTFVYPGIASAPSITMKRFWSTGTGEQLTAFGVHSQLANTSDAILLLNCKVHQELTAEDEPIIVFGESGILPTSGMDDPNFWDLIITEISEEIFDNTPS